MMTLKRNLKQIMKIGDSDLFDNNADFKFWEHISIDFMKRNS